MYSLTGRDQHAVAFAENQRGEIRTSEVSPQLSCAGGKPGSGYPAVCTEARSVAIRGRDGVPQIELGDDKANAILTPNGGRGGIGVGAVLMSIGVDEEQNASEELMGCLKARERGGGFEGAVAFEPRYYAEGRMRPGGAPSETVATLKHSPKAGDTAPHVATSMAVRRLTPRECERLQGFPDDFTAITYKGKPAADGPRYKALGNSMAVPVMRWIGMRIMAVEEIV